MPVMRTVSLQLEGSLWTIYWVRDIPVQMWLCHIPDNSDCWNSVYVLIVINQARGSILLTL
jgi:hypothetical protein